MKRIFDFIVACLAILILSPLLIPIAILLKLTGEGEIFYKQERVGFQNEMFGILKFATMLKNSPNLSGGDITFNKDPRILPVGGFLRKSKINELPQLFNIFFGDMSIIGPRPLTPRVAELFPKEHWQKVSVVRPGLSGVGSIIFRNEEELLENSSDRFEDYKKFIVPYKMALESWYVDNQTFGLDVKLICLTAAVVLFKRIDPHAYLKGLPAPPDDIQQMLNEVSNLL